VDHSGPELERTARRLRRVVLAIRVVFYSGAVVVALVLLPLALPGGVARSDETWLEGTTSQGMPFQLRIDPDGQPGRLMTDFTATCPAGALTVRWWPYKLPRVNDGVLTIHETSTHRYPNYPTGYRTVTFRARVEGGSIHGTMEARERFDDPSYGTYECESGPVTFLARAG
jgi:hypothetical protein